ncbi:MAG: periplasmic heavy metal sensor [Anaeromyxobacter sp.]
MSPFVSGALGAATVIVLAGLLRRAAWHHHHRRALGGRRRFFLRHLFRRIGARPEQEQVISAEADALAAELHALREDARELRAQVAELLSAPTLDAAGVEAALEPRLAKLGAVKARAAEALARVHATLDQRQREALAALVRRGPHGHHHGHCRRAHAA